MRASVIIGKNKNLFFGRYGFIFENNKKRKKLIFPKKNNKNNKFFPKKNKNRFFLDLSIKL